MNARTMCHEALHERLLDLDAWRESHIRSRLHRAQGIKGATHPKVLEARRPKIRRTTNTLATCDVAA